MKNRFFKFASGLALVVLAGTMACSPDVWINNTTSLGSTTVGGRGIVDVAFVNNTPYFAIFTFGAFDPLDETRVPDFRQFFANPIDPDPTVPSDLRLEPDSISDTFTLVCSRSVSVGSQQLLDAISFRGGDADPETLVAGITFSTKLSNDPEAQTFTVDELTNQTVQLGVDYQADSLVTFTFEVDANQPGGIRVDVDVVLP